MINVPSISFKAAPPRRLKPLIEHDGPILDLTFWEKDKVDILEKEKKILQEQVDDINRMLNINKKLTGSTIKKCKFKILNLLKSIDDKEKKIREIKKERYAIQKQEFLQAKS